MALTDNILAYWKLDNNGSGGVSLVDSTPNGNTLTNNNGVTLAVGKINGAAGFDGTVGPLDRSSVVSSGGSFSFWYKAQAGSWQIPISQWYYGGWKIGYSDSSNQFYFFTGEDYYFTTTVAADGNWHHVVVSNIGSGTVAFYFDGSLDGTQSFGAIDFSQSFTLGSDVDGNDKLNGSIDEVGVWNRALTSTEVTALYNGGAGRSYPFFPNFYFNAAVDGNLATLGNWWMDSGFTTPADALPDNSNRVFITAPATSGTATYSLATITANIGSAVSITANTITLNIGINSGTLIGSVVLNNSASNAGTITGNTTLNGSSFNNGTITGYATFNANTYNGINGSVSGDATFRGTEGNAGTVGGAAEFFDTTENSGTVEGNATFRDSSSNAGGVVEGNATIYNPSANPVAGVVMGTETYLWPNGTGLWGGDVWINGDIAFIIPEPSDVRSGVEYGPASAPYVGTYAVMANKTISISQLLKLPFPINI